MEHVHVGGIGSGHLQSGGVGLEWEGGVLMAVV